MRNYGVLVTGDTVEEAFLTAVSLVAAVDTQVTLACCLIMVALCNRADHYIFALLFLSSSSIYLSFFSSPNLSGRRLDVYHTLTHGVALVRI